MWQVHDVEAHGAFPSGGDLGVGWIRVLKRAEKWSPYKRYNAYAHHNHLAEIFSRHAGIPLDIWGYQAYDAKTFGEIRHVRAKYKGCGVSPHGFCYIKYTSEEATDKAHFGLNGAPVCVSGKWAKKF